MIKKIPYINEKLADDLIAQAKQDNFNKRGGNSKAFILDDYVVLETEMLFKEYENPTIEINEEYMHILDRLQEQGVAVVPVLGKCFDNENPEPWGKNKKYSLYTIQPRAEGSELWDNKKMPKYEITAEKTLYLLDRLTTLANAPQWQYDKFVRDYKQIEEAGLVIDPSKRENFFYDEKTGFSFIDLGEGDRRAFDSENHRNFIQYATVPCLWFITNDFAESLSKEDLEQIKKLNTTIFEKCKEALLKVGVSEHDIVDAFKEKEGYGTLKIFGIDNDKYIAEHKTEREK